MNLLSKKEIVEELVEAPLLNQGRVNQYLGLVPSVREVKQ